MGPVWRHCLDVLLSAQGLRQGRGSPDIYSVHHSLALGAQSSQLRAYGELGGRAGLQHLVPEARGVQGMQYTLTALGWDIWTQLCHVYRQS